MKEIKEVYGYQGIFQGGSTCPWSLNSELDFLFFMDLLRPALLCKNTFYPELLGVSQIIKKRKKKRKQGEESSGN